jgi:hypothetical protein
MRTILILNNLILILVTAQSGRTVAASANFASRPAFEAGLSEEANSLSNLTVALKTPTEATITFKSKNAAEVNAPAGVDRRIPHLVLNRNGVLTPGFERTLLLSLDHLAVPRSGLYAHLVIETEHSDPDQGKANAEKIQVWDETKFVAYPSVPGGSSTLDFTITFQRLLDRKDRSIRTPTDYYSYRISLFDSQGNSLREIREEYAFLMEDQWRVPLPPVLEETPGAAPNELVIYYCDMIRFQAGLRDPETQIPRTDVGRYIQTELIPAMVDAFETQTNLWQLPWYSEWSNFRRDEDPKTLSVALGEKGTWFHGEAASLGHDMISIRVDGTFGDYANLTDGIMSVFHHELFHNQQRNLSFHLGSRGNISGMDDAWQPFSEGTAVLASSVGQSAVQFEPFARSRSYFKRANAFLGAEGMQGGGLNKSYKSMPYQTAIYWRFLYEHCGGIKYGIEDPAAGMRVIREALETLYRGEVVDINSSTDLAGSLPHVLDIALKNTPSCEFHTYEESLIHFARAVYLLRLEDPTCLVIRYLSSCGLYDPYQLYQTPNAESYPIAATTGTLIRGSIPSSYGIDLLELDLDPALHRPLRIRFQNMSGAQGQFSIQLWESRTSESAAGAQRPTPRTGEPLSVETDDGFVTIELDAPGTNNFNHLGLIITRLDPHEDVDSAGEYELQVSVK